MAKTQIGKALERVLQIEGKTKRKLAEDMGVSDAQVQNYFNMDIRFSSFLKILDALGYEMVLRKATGMGTINVPLPSDDPCEKCFYKEYSVKMDELSQQLRVYAAKNGVEIDYHKFDEEIDLYKNK